MTSINKLSGIIFAYIFWAFCAANVYGQTNDNGVNIGLVYPVSIQGIQSKAHTNIFSLHALMGISRGEKAFSAAGLSNIVFEDASGFQVSGLYNQIGGNATGFTTAGLMNRYNNATGFQAAGLLNLSGDVEGTQVGGFMNIAHHVQGTQLAGFYNRADGVHGVQVAGFINQASDTDGAQVAGFINKAGKVRGIQLAGFINIADSSDYPLAPVNIIGNGEKWLGVTVDDNVSTLVTFRSGSRKVYGIVGAGYNHNNADKLITIQYGLGAHLFYDHRLHLNTEATVNHFTGGGTGMLFKSSLSALAALRASQRVEIFAGPSFNYVNVTSDTDRDMVNDYVWRHGSVAGSNRMYGLYIGYTAGIHFSLP